MKIDEAKLQLDIAERNLRGCEREYLRSMAECREAERAGGSHDVHRRLKALYGDDYRYKIEANREGTKRLYDEARNELVERKSAYELALTQCGPPPHSP